jgi:hypothetical protein
MTKDYAQMLLKDKDIKALLKEMILDKANRYDQLTDGEKLLTEEQIDKSLGSDITYKKIKAIYEDYEAKKEIQILERDLISMCFALNKSEKIIPAQTSWERAYEHATRNVQISQVFSYFFGINNFKKNVSCPFHGEDRNPSLKVYPDDNYFICFACGAKGSSVDFIMKYKDCSFKEAVKYLSIL